MEKIEISILPGEGRERLRVCFSEKTEKGEFIAALCKFISANKLISLKLFLYSTSKKEMYFRIDEKLPETEEQRNIEMKELTGFNESIAYEYAGKMIIAVVNKDFISRFIRLVKESYPDYNNEGCKSFINGKYYLVIIQK